jgi:hypothetical protein
VRRYATFVLIACALCSTLALAEASSAPGERLTVPADRIIAGPTVRLPERTVGDLIAAGGRVEVAEPVGGDAVLAGGELHVSGSLARNVYVAGGRVQLVGEMGRNLRAAGGQVELGSSARLAGNATIAAGDVSVRGPIKGSLSIAGGRVLIDSTVDGDVTVVAGQIELGPQARIGGALRWRSQGELQRHASSQVAGPIERLAPMPGREGAAGWLSESRYAIGWLAGTWWTVGLMIVAAVLLAAVPGLASEVAQTWRERAGTSLLAGFVALVCIPVAVLILFVTVIGVPLALIALLLYFVLLPMGYVSSAIGLGQWGLARWKSDVVGHPGWRIGATSLALVLLALLGAVPRLGGVVALAALLVGLGAIVLQLWPRKTAAPA